MLDIGVGSGCILLSILKERNNFYGTGIDISKKSLDISKINAKWKKLWYIVKTGSRMKIQIFALALEMDTQIF